MNLSQLEFFQYIGGLALCWSLFSRKGVYTLELKYNGESDSLTANVRAILYFLLIENKIIKQVRYQDFEGADGFSRYMALHLK